MLKHGYSQRELAEQTGLSQMTISYSLHKKPVSLKNLKLIADACEVKPEVTDLNNKKINIDSIPKNYQHSAVMIKKDMMALAMLVMKDSEAKEATRQEAVKIVEKYVA